MIRVLSIMLLLTGCLKTSDQIRREKIVDTMSVQMKESQQMVADLNLKLQEFQEKATQFQGQVEELEHKQKELSSSQTKEINENLNQLNAQVSTLQKTVDSQQKEINTLKAQVNNQKKFVSKVTNSLQGLSDSPNDQYKKAMNYMKKNYYTKATPILEELVNAKIDAAKKNGVYYNLGFLRFRAKNYDECLVYMSKIYTKYPKSSYAPKALLYIARSFAKQGKKTEAQATYGTIIKDYAKTSQAQEAKKEIKKL